MSKKVRILLILSALLIASLLTLAPNTPPGEPASCSPGFWKNHTELWEPYPSRDFNDYFGYPEKPDGFSLLDALQGGKDTRETRFIVAGALNYLYPDAPCED